MDSILSELQGIKGLAVTFTVFCGMDDDWLRFMGASPLLSNLVLIVAYHILFLMVPVSTPKVGKG
jgi:hypothetical protein